MTTRARRPGRTQPGVATFLRDLETVTHGVSCPARRSSEGDRSASTGARGGLERHRATRDVGRCDCATAWSASSRPTRRHGQRRARVSARYRAHRTTASSWDGRPGPGQRATSRSYYASSPWRPTIAAGGGADGLRRCSMSDAMVVPRRLREVGGRPGDRRRAARRCGPGREAGARSPRLRCIADTRSSPRPRGRRRTGRGPGPRARRLGAAIWSTRRRGRRGVLSLTAGRARPDGVSLGPACRRRQSRLLGSQVPARWRARRSSSA